MQKGVRKMEIKIVVPWWLWHKLYYFYNDENFRFKIKKNLKIKSMGRFFKKNTLEYIWNIVI
jgi:hypothetical protein